MCTDTNSNDDPWEIVDTLYEDLQECELENDELWEKNRLLKEENDMLTKMLKAKDEQISQMLSRSRLLVSNLNLLLDDMRSEICNGDHT